MVYFVMELRLVTLLLVVSQHPILARAQLHSVTRLWINVTSVQLTGKCELLCMERYVCVYSIITYLIRLPYCIMAVIAMIIIYAMVLRRALPELVFQVPQSVVMMVWDVL